jgi:MFS family permease
VALTAAILSGGTLGDRYGRKLVYLTGLAVFTVASVGCALAPTLEVLVAARIVQGFAASAVIPGSVALLAHAFIVVELRAPHPMLPVRLFARIRFSVAIFAVWSLGFAASRPSAPSRSFCWTRRARTGWWRSLSRWRAPPTGCR